MSLLLLGTLTLTLSPLTQFFSPSAPAKASVWFSSRGSRQRNSNNNNNNKTFQALVVVSALNGSSVLPFFIRIEPYREHGITDMLDLRHRIRRKAGSSRTATVASQ